jgi:ribulose 1,5-bisphosphate synthetase/thiazole synthase
MTKKSENIAVDKGRRRLLQGVLAAPLINSRVFARNGKTFDTIIVGAGVFGAWTAWHLSRAGQTVSLILQQHLCWGSEFVNTRTAVMEITCSTSIRH